MFARAILAFFRCAWLARRPSPPLPRRRTSASPPRHVDPRFSYRGLARLGSRPRPSAASTALPCPVRPACNLQRLAKRQAHTNSPECAAGSCQEALGRHCCGQFASEDAEPAGGLHCFGPYWRGVMVRIRIAPRCMEGKTGCSDSIYLNRNSDFALNCTEKVLRKG